MENQKVNLKEIGLNQEEAEFCVWLFNNNHEGAVVENAEYIYVDCLIEKGMDYIRKGTLTEGGVILIYSVIQKFNKFEKEEIERIDREDFERFEKVCDMENELIEQGYKNTDEIEDEKIEQLYYEMKIEKYYRSELEKIFGEPVGENYSEEDIKGILEIKNNNSGISLEKAVDMYSGGM